MNPMRPVWRIIGGGLALASVAGCDVTRVAAPGIVTPQTYENPNGAVALRNGAIGSFYPPVSEQALFSGLLVDEFFATPNNALPEDQRTVTPTNSSRYPYELLSASRLNALNAISALKQYAPTPAWRIAELYGIVAGVEIFFGEDMCSGVPLASVQNGTPVVGASLTTSQLLAQALVDLDSAAVYATSNDSIASFVSVLRGRALLDGAQPAQAAAAVTQVPIGFLYQAQFDTGYVLGADWITLYSNQAQVIGVSDREGVNGLPFVSANDPRVPTTTVSGVAVDAQFNLPSAPVTIASGVEAQLIVAEADLATGQVTAWAGVLNHLRQTAIAPAMSPLPVDSTTAAPAAMQLAVMFRERAFWLFASGHRHGDLRRLVRQYGLPVNSVFPTGVYEGGPLEYGSSTVFPPYNESPYNSTYQGCVDTNP
jgi:hypothetical protein